ncbi:unnamed protein product [Rotaria magnacalcarata]|uniref:Uncharacterized protein n=4 Tax=Rotaria magnacalcarata TaxID=392030 RepID=A0A816FGD9_9BILA|nr:unnamed protein product [Rotaria magnacalcarata]CAF4037210.1 unnamed protein product [Rotaria magnacalcarata]
MLSRVTLWRRRKRIKEIRSQMIANKCSFLDEESLELASSSISNSISAKGFPDNEARPINDCEYQFSHTIPDPDSNISKTTDEAECVPDFNEDQMWIDDNVKESDPWMNLTIEPVFQYPVMENQELFVNMTRDPVEKEIAAALVLLKVRHRISTKGMDDICKLLKILKTPNAPLNFSRIKRLFFRNSSPTLSSSISFICSACCDASTSSNHCNNINCSQHASYQTPPLQYFKLSILQQLREILACEQDLNFEHQKQPSLNSDLLNDIYDGDKYQHIIKNEIGNRFLTLVMNADGVQVSKDASLSLWIITFAINEIKRSERFKLKNIIIGGIVSCPSKPTRNHMRKIFAPIIQELLILERGETFEVKSLNENPFICLKTYLIACCADKPAQSLVQSISEPIGAYGCGRCEIEGITVPIKPNSKKKIRVFPLVTAHQQQPRLRTNETYDEFMKIYAQERFKDTNEMRDRLRGHIGPCSLRDLTYFDVGTSFLSDSLHNVYHGVMKRLFRLWFDKKYRTQPWSIRSKLKVISHFLTEVKYPSTSTRIPRHIEKYEKYKANEERSVLLFGFSAFCSALPLKYARHFLLLVVAMHTAESRSIQREQIKDISLMLNRFLQLFPILYSPRQNSQAVHSLHHIATSVLEYGALSNYSTFNFENILGLITSTVHSTRRHSCEIQNNLRLLRLASIELDHASFNRNLKQFINACQSSKRSVVLITMNESQTVHFRREDTNKVILMELQHLLRQHEIKLFNICYILTNRFTVMDYRSSGQKNDSCLLFLQAGKPCIGFIQNIIQVHRTELILRVCKVKIRDQLCLNFDNNRLSCPNIFYGSIDMQDNIIFIKANAILEKIVHVYHKQLKCYIFCRIPNLLECS